MEYIGELAALAAAVLWSFSSIVFTAASKRIGSIQLNINRMIIAIFLLLLTFLIFDIDLSLTWTQIFYLTLSGIVGLVLGDSFLFKSFELIGPRLGLLIMSFNPAIAALMAYFILGEFLAIWGVAGIVLTLTGVSIVVLERPKKSAAFKPSPAGVACGFLAAAGQGAGLVLAKLAFLEADVHSVTATFARILSATIIFLPVAVLMKKYKNPFKLFFNDRKALWLVSLGALIGPYLGIALSFLAIVYAKVGVASTLMSTMPVIMLPLSVWFYKEKLTFFAIVGAFVAVAGVSMLFLK